MDLDKLRKLSQEGRKNLEKEVLQLCNPQEIALEIMNNLEKNAFEKAKIAEHNAETYFTIYSWNRPLDYGHGLFFKTRTSNLYEMSKILFEMVKKHISDEDIQLSFVNEENQNVQDLGIHASLSW